MTFFFLPFFVSQESNLKNKKQFYLSLDEEDKQQYSVGVSYKCTYSVQITIWCLFSNITVS